ncbi:MAG: OmpP1/FadL family transporter [Hasllibacter sp.]
MNRFLTTTALLAIAATGASAAGLDRSNQPLGVLFGDGEQVELSFGFVRPSISGTDVTGRQYDDVGQEYVQFGFGYLNRLNDRFSYAILVDEPFGADVDYGEGMGGVGLNEIRFDPTVPGGIAPTGRTVGILDNTLADVNSVAVSVVPRYELGNGFSVHGGLRIQQVGGAVEVPNSLDLTTGTAFDTPRFQFEDDIGLGYLVGAAYERPDIALRLAITYYSEVDHTLQTTGGFAGSSGETETSTPDAINIDFQTGIAADTLLTASYRYSDWSEFTLDPYGDGDAGVFPGSPGGIGNVASIDDGHRLTLGVARRFTEDFAGSVTINYEPDGGETVSVLGPTDGSLGITLGGRYTRDAFVVSGGINYTKLGDAIGTAGGNEVATFEDNYAIGAGIRVNYNF